MAVLNFVSFSDNSILSVTTGGSNAPTLDATNAHGGSGYSMLVSLATTQTGFATLFNVGAAGTTATDFNIASSWAHFRFRVETLPASGDEPIFQILNVTPAQKIAVRITSAGELAVYDSANTLVATGAASISVNTWYEVAVRSTTSGSASAYEVTVDGVSYLSGTCTQTNSNARQFLFGRVAAISSQSYICRFDNMFIDDAGFQHGTEVVALRPNANGSTMQWTAGTGASDYTQVDEIVLDDTDYVMSAGGTGDVALFALPDCAAAGITGTILAVKATNSVLENVNATSATRVRIRAGGTNSDTNASNLSITNTYRYQVRSTDPSTSVAWTLSGVDGLEIGAVEDGVAIIRLNQTFASVLFIPAAPTGHPAARRFGNTRFGRPVEVGRKGVRVA